MKERIGSEGLDLLWRLFDLNPATRISSEAAIQHPFFDSIRNIQNPLENFKFDYSV
jgi:serine/threonine protein kinase